MLVDSWTLGPNLGYAGRLREPIKIPAFHWLLFNTIVPNKMTLFVELFHHLFPPPVHSRPVEHVEDKEQDGEQAEKDEVGVRVAVGASSAHSFTLGLSVFHRSVVMGLGCSHFL